MNRPENTSIENYMNKIPLIKPYITAEVKKKVREVLDSGYLTEGPVTRQFEDSIRDYVGSKYAMAVCNCSVGLELALRSLGVGPGDEIIVPDYTYPVTASVVNIVGATVVIVDVDPETMLIDYNAVEEAVTSKTKAIIPVSIFGNPLDYDRLWEIKKKHNLYLIEDAACSIGARYDGKFVGNLADISVFSFHPRKFITTGEGGMVTTNNPELAEWMESYKHFGMAQSDSRHRTQFELIGTNYKLSNVQAAIGLAQMQQIESLLQKRSQLANRYVELFADAPAVSFPKITPKGVHSWQSCCILVPNRNHIIEKLKGKNIETQIGTYSLHMHKAFNENADCIMHGEMPGSRYAFDRCLTLPLFHDMKDEEQQYVVSELLMSMTSEK
jgi:dTDP-4-amino-4,6-dideoxygalactose transaminase